MKTLNKILLAIPLAIGITNCATKIHGNIDLSYVPVRMEEKAYQNELRTEVDVHSETPIGKVGLDIGSKLITYMNLSQNAGFGGLFHPTNQDYVFYARANIPLRNFKIELYGQHNCFHPVNKEYISRILEGHLITTVFSQAETRLGVNLKW